jgi:hypothetical protein
VASLTEIHIRDPFVLPVPEERLYYLFGTTGAGVGFDCYRSADLDDWEGPIPAFRPPAGFSADRDFWAPEVHVLDGVHYMFASLKSPDRRRGTQVFASARPEGPYLPHSAGPLTPAEWECLDGTLFVDAAGRPHLVFCHEWVQVGDGEICALALRPDLRGPAGPPRLLFRASAAAWVHRPAPDGGSPRLVTDGPFLYRGRDGALGMLWSSFSVRGYAVGLAMSVSGALDGPWSQRTTPVYDAGGGHAMRFRDFAGRDWLALHAPNGGGAERARLLPVRETAAGLDLGAAPEAGAAGGPPHPRA